VATIVVLEHQLQERLGIAYMAYEFARRWTERGHRVIYHRGVDAPPPGDVAILHVDLTEVPESYRALEKHYPHVINSRTWDIRKSRYSMAKVKRTDPWPGKVIIKTEANHGGHVDDRLRRMALEEGIATDVPERTLMDAYFLCDSIRHVPAGIWDAPGVIVEKFIPESDERGNYVRIWTFFGSQYRSTRYCSTDALIRISNFVSREPVEVPEAMRAWREKLGFEYGKFDYVLHEGEYILLDANRTPGAPASFAEHPEIVASFDKIATGIDDFL